MAVRRTCCSLGHVNGILTDRRDAEWRRREDNTRNITGGIHDDIDILSTCDVTHTHREAVDRVVDLVDGDDLLRHLLGQEVGDQQDEGNN